MEYRLFPKQVRVANSKITEFSFDRSHFDDFGYEIDFKQYNTTDML